MGKHDNGVIVGCVRDWCCRVRHADNDASEVHEYITVDGVGESVHVYDVECSPLLEGQRTARVGSCVCRPRIFCCEAEQGCCSSLGSRVWRLVSPSLCLLVMNSRRQLKGHLFRVEMQQCLSFGLENFLDSDTYIWQEVISMRENGGKICLNPPKATV